MKLLYRSILLVFLLTTEILQLSAQENNKAEDWMHIFQMRLLPGMYRVCQLQLSGMIQ